MADSPVHVEKCLRQVFHPSTTTILMPLPSQPREAMSMTCRSFPAFRIKKSYWPKEKSPARSNSHRCRSNAVFPHSFLTSYRKKRSPQPAPVLTPARDRPSKFYDSLSKHKRIFAATSDGISWRPKPLATARKPEEVTSTVEACRNMCLSFDSHVGKYSVGFREDFKNNFTAKLISYLAEHRKARKEETPRTRKLGKLRLRPQKAERQSNCSIGNYMLDLRLTLTEP